MKKQILAMALLALAISSATAQKKKLVKQIDVTARTIASQPSSKAYLIDLTHTGTTYSFAAGVDYSRVRVRTSKGEMTLTELLAKTGKTVTGKLSIGMTSDLRAQRIGLTRVRGGGLRFNPDTDCGGLVCACNDPDGQDCIDMFDSGKCGPIAICYPDGCICLRL
jgi:hypothetical protein